MYNPKLQFVLILSLLLSASSASAADLPAPTREFIQKRCMECHDAETKKGDLDLSALKTDFADAPTLARWIKIYDRIESGEMPPKKKARPAAAELEPVMAWLKQTLTAADEARLAAAGRTPLRRLTRVEYENTLRDLFDMPGIALQALLPPDGTAHGFDKNAEALSISHVNLAKYVEAADLTLDLAIATRPTPPVVQKVRTSLLDRGGFTSGMAMQGDAVLLRDMKIDPAFPPAGAQRHQDQGAHEMLGMFETGSSVGLFRHEDESTSHYFRGHTTIYPGRYRVRTSTWAFKWDKGEILPARGTEALRLSVVQLTADGRGGQHPSYAVGYYDAPSLKPTEHEMDVWLNANEMMGCDVASLAPVANYSRKGHAMAFTGPTIVIDWLDVEGPLNDVWPPRSHEVLFGRLPLAQFAPKDNPAIRPPARRDFEKQWLRLGKNQVDPVKEIWTVSSQEPLADADRLLASFLPKLFRRPVPNEIRQRYVGLVEARLKAGDCFESALRWACRTALCSPDFLFHNQPQTNRDEFPLANRLSYFLWNSLPDEQLIQLAASGALHEAAQLRVQTERLLNDKRSTRFIEDFLGQWLKLRSIAANDPDKKLYPEFSPYLQDSMVAETRAYFRELLEKNLDIAHIVRSDFAMINEKLAVHYGIEGVSGPAIRRVGLPSDCLRGGLLTQASILKITANGTTTSPVPRGAFVMGRILGKPPEPPPASVPAVEPDVRGAVTIRQQLDQHRNDPGCAGCHAKIDPPGFALESFDVIGGYRTRYRSLENGDPAPRGKIDPFVGIKFLLGPAVDCTGQMPDGRPFKDIRELQAHLAADRRQLLKNLAEQFLVYATGREIAFRDRDAITAIVSAAEKQGAGVRTLLHEVIQSPLFNEVRVGNDLQIRIIRPSTPPPHPPIVASKLIEPQYPAAPPIGNPVTVKYRVFGLFQPDRVEDLRKQAGIMQTRQLEQNSQVKLVDIDFNAATATFAYDPSHKEFKNVKPDQVQQRINEMLRNASHGCFLISPVNTAGDQLKKEEIAVAGLDCKGCAFGAYRAVANLEGVDRATVNFKEGRLIAWIDATKINRQTLLDALKKAQVELPGVKK